MRPAALVVERGLDVRHVDPDGGLKIDKAAPVISPTATVTGGDAYVADTWTNKDVTVSFSCADSGGSGVASDTIGGGDTYTASETLVSSTGACTDNAGNAADGGSFGPIKIDKTAPVLTLPTSVTRYATVASGTSVTWNASAIDAVSGTETVNCTPASGSNFTVGVTLVTCSAQDDLGNESTGSFNVYVGRFHGFFNPVDNGVINTMKAGATAPIKFRVTDPSGNVISKKVRALLAPTRIAQVQILSVSAKTAHGGWKAPTRFLPSGRFTPVLPPMAASTTYEFDGERGRTFVRNWTPNPSEGDDATFTFTGDTKPRIPDALPAAN